MICSFSISYIKNPACPQVYGLGSCRYVIFLRQIRQYRYSPHHPVTEGDNAIQANGHVYLSFHNSTHIQQTVDILLNHWVKQVYNITGKTMRIAAMPVAKWNHSCPVIGSLVIHTLVTLYFHTAYRLLPPIGRPINSLIRYSFLIKHVWPHSGQTFWHSYVYIYKIITEFSIRKLCDMSAFVNNANIHR